MATAAALSWKEQCQNLLEILNQSEDADPFREPIDILYVPDYLQVIEHPMDLQTVREKLEANNYATPNAFAKDVRLIFENSRKFNTNTKSKIYGQTVRLSFLFEEYFLNILDTYETQKTTDGCKSKLFLLNSPFVNLQSQCFVDNSGNLHSKPTNSKTAKVVEFSKEAIKIVSSRANKRQQVRNPIPS